MEIDLPTIILGALFTVLLILPFVLLSRSGKKRKRAVEEKLTGLALHYQVKVTDYDVWADKAIALDKNDRQLLFVGGVNNQTIIDLKKYSKVTVRKDTLKPGEKASFEISKVELVFESPVAGRRPLSLVFFDLNHDDPFEGGQCYELAKAWSSKISECLGRPTKLKQAA